jgi:hypothetical protein
MRETRQSGSAGGEAETNRPSLPRYQFLQRCGTAAIPRRATRRVATRQLPQAYPPQRGIVERDRNSI